jgi:hypothetical protein
MKDLRAKRIEEGEVQALRWHQSDDLVDPLVAVTFDDSNARVGRGADSESMNVGRIEDRSRISRENGALSCANAMRALPGSVCLQSESAPCRWAGKEVDGGSPAAAYRLDESRPNSAGGGQVCAESIVFQPRPCAHRLGRQAVLCRQFTVLVAELPYPRTDTVPRRSLSPPTGISLYSRPSRSRPVRPFWTPPHCLKKNATPEP